jgi:hypothetical protein
MKPRYNYIPGAYNLICDRTGFKIKSTDARREWNGNVVRSKSFEERHPQDFVRAKMDRQAVPVPRPDTDSQGQVTETTLDAAEEAGQTVLSVADTTRFTAGDAIQIKLDGDLWHTSSIVSFSAGDTVTIAAGLPSRASSGNAVHVITGTVSL